MRCGREVERTDPSGPQEVAIVAHLAYHRDTYTANVAPPLTGPAGCHPLCSLPLLDLSLRELKNKGSKKVTILHVI